ncbi:hypothetical protein [Geopsychrobacter electrodiphilus]|uniref:hypothetical protein n=1 Tax=Geopsychrobacter electrodiphilus TaxID=225196 RepID=UPI00037A90EC|nr:hypothetical protein [Geopsychrobacter electrodiphilus]
MKTKMILALLASFFLLGGTAFAFHDGGVAHCDGCHSMHNSADNLRKGSATAADLMKGSDASSTCLNCHEGSGRYKVDSADGTNTKAGGDFGWLKTAMDYLVDTNHDGIPDAKAGTDNRGHNVIALDYGLAVDGTNVTGPGGSIPANTLGCTSCHNPHGQVAGGTAGGSAPISASGSYGDVAPTDGSILGNYRLLGSAGYKAITAAAPIARADSYTSNSVDYGKGMSGWCLSCHPSFNDTANMHPTGPVTQGRFDGIYNSYVKTGDYSGVVASSYDALVPFERNVASGDLLDETSTYGADGNSRVMCLSCHRAHASAFDNALRWDNKVAFMEESSIVQNQVQLGTFATAAPYYKNGVKIDIVAEYGQYQRQLCNKCHAKD